jgi:hypothetical protein
MARADDAALDEFAAAAGISASWATRLMRLAYLSPRFMAAILISQNRGLSQRIGDFPPVSRVPPN